MSEGKPRWTGGLQSRLFIVVTVLAAGLGVHWLLFVFVSISVGDGPPELASSFDVGWVESSEDALGDDWVDSALLFDAEPLFLPTEWNSASDLGGIARLRDATELFPPYPDLVGELAIAALALSVESTKDLSALPDPVKPFRLFLDVASEGLETASMAGVFVRIRSINENGPPIEITETLPIDVGQAPSTLWNPVESLMILDPAFGTEMPLKLSSSGSVEWDRLLTEALSQSAILEQLPYGYYQVFVAE